MGIDKMFFRFFRFCFSVNLFINHFYIFRVITIVNRSFSTQVLKMIFRFFRFWFSVNLFINHFYAPPPKKWRGIMLYPLKF